MGARPDDGPFPLPRIPATNAGGRSPGRWARVWSIAGLALTVLGSAPLAAADPPARAALEQFEREVRPVLATACGGCHGAKKQEGGLRVDSRAALLRGGDRGPALVPGSADQSLILVAVRRSADLKMPPDKALSAEQVTAIVRWIENGAPWPIEAAPGGTRGGPITQAERHHWAFRPPVASRPPAVDDPDWCRTPIDNYLRHALDAQQIPPAPDADRRTLDRRLRLVLTGLPGDIDEQREFAQDSSPDAVARLVDRLLADPAQGERWGRHWLDVVRYADTAGDGADYPVREAYRYRNYVIRSLAADKPFDQFVREQLAGDLLAAQRLVAGDVSPETYAELVTATGYLAIAKRFGYNVNTEFQHLDLADVIEGFGRSLLGLSIGCARCHDHKYDPLNMADYYALYGIFASSRFSFPGGEEHKRPEQLVPLVTPAVVAEREQARAVQLERSHTEIQRLLDQRAALAARLPDAGAERAFEAQTAGQPPAKPWFQAGRNVVTPAAQSPFNNAYPAGQRGVRMTSGDPHDGVRWELSAPVTAAAGEKLYFNLDFRNVEPTAQQGGAYRLYLGQGAIQSLAIELGVSGTDVAIRQNGAWEVVRTLQPDRWYNVRLTVDLARRTFDGRISGFGAGEDVVSFQGKSCAADWNGSINTFFCDGLGHRAGERPTHDLDNLVIQTTPIVDPRERTPLSDDERAQIAAELLTVDKSIAARRAEVEAAARQALFPAAYAVSEGTPQDARIQKRGEPDRLGDVAPRRNVEILGGELLSPQVAGQGSGRDELAYWVTRPENPLTARVIVNRVWQHLFGTGLVSTESDFGTRGEPPTHPELLDDLARRFADSGWSLKRLQRELVLSHAWQLASDGPELGLQRDPANRWRGRFSRRALDAEMVRDGILWASGRLDRAMPGPHPFPTVETWGFTIHYPFHAVYDSPHRSVYLMIQRQRKQPYLSLFDGADPNISTARRLPTTTPTQALYLMNSPFMHEHSRELARRIVASAADDVSRVEWAFEVLYGRPPDVDQRDAALDFLRQYRHRAAAAGGSGSAGGVAAPAGDVDAWSGLARVLLTSNGFLFLE